MRVIDVAGFLVGRRDSILALWSDRWCLAVGAMLVLSGSLARNYDGHDLVREGYVLLHGFGASIGNSLLLYALFRVALAIGRRTGDKPPPVPFGRNILSFLGVFWMTAPMAWLYGVPYEHFLDPYNAVKANLWTLGLVSLWRVLLISRVLSVAHGVPFLAVLMITMVFGDALAIAAVMYAPTPTLDMMGGLRHPPEIQIIASAAFSVFVYGVLSAPVWILGAIIGIVWLKPQREPPALTLARVPRGLMAVAIAAIVVWLAAAWMMQPDVRRKYDVERAVAHERYAEAIDVLSAHPRSDFPPVWDLPPRPVRGGPDTGAAMAALRREIDARPAVAEWVRHAYADKTIRDFDAQVHGLAWRRYEISTETIAQEVVWSDLGADEVARMAEFISKHAPALDETQRTWWLDLKGDIKNAASEKEAPERK